MSAARVAFLLFGSGLCSLVYQVAWLRDLRLVFGASTAASAAVLAIFMAGLGLGGWVLGRRVDRSPRPLAVYGWLEVGIATAAALSPLLILAIRAAYVGLGGTQALGSFGGTAVRLLLAGLVLGLPTFLMGGTLPAVARAVERAQDRGRRSVALLYGANTLGAVTGAAVTTFLTLELLGVRRSIWAAAVLNLWIALLALALSRWAGEGTAETEPHGADTRAAETQTAGSEGKPETEPGDEPGTGPETGPESRRPPLPFVLGAAAMVGFAFFLMELVWYRMLAPLLGGSSYTFGLILAVALLGIGGGGLLYAAGSRNRRPTLASFAATCSLEALFLILPFALGDRLAVLALVLRPLGDGGFGLLVGSWTLLTAVVVLPTALVAGYQFPLLVAVLGEGREGVGREVGLTYAWNTVGAIVGSIAGGFGLLPLLTAPGTWRLVAVLLVALAVTALVVAARAMPVRPMERREHRPGRWGSRLRRLGLPLGAGLVALVLTSATGPTAFWRHSPIGAGRLPATFEDANGLRKLMTERRLSVVWEAEGVESSIALDALNQYMFTVNGKADGSALRDAPNMVMSVILGALLHPDPRQALVIGLGAGTSAGWMAEVPSMERVVVAELEPAVAHIAEVCAPVNFEVLHHPKVEMVWGDGRELLLTDDTRYDLIFSQPSNPYRAGIASLFSRELYEAAAERLDEGGLLLQWLQGYETDGRVVRMAYATLGSVFPHVESWQVHVNDLLLVASKEPLTHSLPQLRERLTRSPYREALERTWGVPGVEGLYTGYLGNGDLARRLAREHTESGGRLNTDDHPVMEFGFVRNLGREGLFDIERLRALAVSWDVHRPRVSGEGDVDWRQVQELRSASQVIWGGRPWIDPGLSSEALARVRARQAYRANDLPGALAHWLAGGPSGENGGAPGLMAPRSPVDELLLAETLAEAADPRALRAMADLRSERPHEAVAVLARWHARRGEAGEAAQQLGRLFAAVREDPWVDPALLARSLVLAQELGGTSPVLARQIFTDLGEPFAVLLLDELRRRVRLELAKRSDFAGLCPEALAAFEPHVPWEGRLLVDRLECYRRTDDPRLEQAQTDLDRFLAEAPPRLEQGLVPRRTDG